ncbi:sugar transferase [Acidobacteria bacterium AB60]|nr:sugar transferase [Acidobacteria bacterium AB60]
MVNPVESLGSAHQDNVLFRAANLSVSREEKSVSSHWLGEVASVHVFLLVSYPFIRIFSQGSAEEFAHSRPGVAAASAWVNSRTRRLLDITVAALALLLLSPLMALCWVLVRRSSPGPVLFRQLRAGRNGKEFALYKFRSMRIESRVPAGHTVLGDSRITPAGAFLRRYKMDELPQFWNVLKGDMSLVGPRPKLAHHDGLCLPCRPGLTGQATLAFRHEERMLLEIPRTEVEQFYASVLKPIKAALDINYMENATFLSDVRLLGQTFFRCIRCSTDARRELLALLERYAPHEIGVLREEPRTPLPSFLPELTSDLVGDLDDAA